MRKVSAAIPNAFTSPAFPPVPTSAVSAWARAGGDLETVGRITADEMEDRLREGEVRLLDVRWEDEWERGRIPEAIHLPMGQLDERLDEVPNGRPLVLHCASGARSAIAASLLQLRGFKDVSNLEGGFDLWSAEERPVER
jgi:hydroxyacylglutathione hydrolase